MNNVVSFYEKYDEATRLSRDNARKVEFTMTVNLLNQYIKPKDKILELGAGTGAYSFYYARKGNCVEATDLTPKHIKIMEEKLKEENNNLNLHIELADATDLQKFQDESFDVINCLGPMYHIKSEEDREKCVKEALRVLKPGGILAVSYINKHFLIQSVMASQKEFFSDDFVDKILTSGLDEGGREDCFYTVGYFTTPEKAEDFMSRFSVEIIDHAAIDGISPLLKDKINELDDKQYSAWINYCLKSCRDRSTLGISNHGLIICRKVNTTL